MATAKPKPDEAPANDVPADQVDDAPERARDRVAMLSLNADGSVAGHDPEVIGGGTGRPADETLEG